MAAAVQIVRAGLLGAFYGIVFTILFAAKSAHAGEAIPILIITGMDHPAHDWKTSTLALREVLSADGRMKVEVLDDPYRLDRTDLARFRVVMLHFNNWERPDPGAEAKRRLAEFTANGGGLVVLHFACGAFPQWPEYATLAGRIWDGTNTHDPRGRFTVEIVNTNHAVTRGLSSFATDDELYFCLAGSKPVELLATARSKVTGRDEPMAMVHDYGKGRVFLTPLGHDARAIRAEGAAELIRRGCAWVAGEEPAVQRRASPNDGARPVGRAKFWMPPGFEIELAAAEPDVANPMTMCVDEHGGLFVTEAHTYRWGPEKSPYQPPSNPIKRIEFDREGKPSRVVTVSEGYPNPVMGICAYKGTLFATCLNELFAMELSPDGRLVNKALLVKDAASPWNPFGMYRVVVGPDAHLWLAVGDHPGSQPVDLTGSDGSRIRFRGQSGGLARCRLDGGGLELIAHGFRAPYAFDFDPWGHIWQVSNGEGSPNLLVHVIPGVDYGYASRDASYDWLAGKEPFSPPVREMGAGANTAARHYYSSMFPREYWGNIFVANWGSHGKAPPNRRITRYRREREGISHNGAPDSALVEAGVFLTCEDPKFRPTDIVLAADGSMFVSDWHGEDDENDRSGRIYRIRYGAHDAGHHVKAADPSERIATQIDDRNPSIRRAAREELIRRGEWDLLKKILKNGSPLAAGEVASSSALLEQKQAWELLLSGLEHPDSRVRAHALRQMRQTAGLPLSAVGSISAPKGGAEISPEVLAEAARPLMNDADAEVRVEAALAQRSSAEISAGLVSALSGAAGGRLRYQIAFHLARHACAELVRAMFRSADASVRMAGLLTLDIAKHENPALIEQVRQAHPELLEAPPPESYARKIARLARQADSRALSDEFAMLEAKARTLNFPAEKLAALRVLEQWQTKISPLPSSWIESLLGDPEVQVQEEAVRAARRLGLKSPVVIQRVRELSRSGATDGIRVEAFFFLGQTAEARRVEDFSFCLTNCEPLFARAVLRAFRENPPDVDEIERVQGLARELAIRHPELEEELELILPAGGAARKDSAVPNGNASLDSRANQKFSAALASASPGLGRLVFESRRFGCATCHAVRAGETRFGPSLAGIGGSAQTEYLLESILDPSKVIKTGFQVESVELADGRVFEGLVDSRGSDLSIRSSADITMIIPAAEVKDRKPLSLSPMPAGLSAGMSTAELADLIAYLRTLK